METQNANPTILSVSDLPSRRLEQKKSSPSSLLSGTVPAYTRDPFATGTGADYSSSDDDESEDDSVVEKIDEQEIYDLIATISDPEHPLTLGELAVVNLPHIQVTDDPSSLTGRVLVELTPTINHCSLATVIGLGVRVRLEQALPPRFRLDVRIREGTHATGDQVNKQLNDKERVASALENETLMGVVGKMLESCK
ncbi:uncharacterized protein H6S33_006472 [Morchella sextelata]|uniref:uncharacterized protein n=1 Tax=Morchella sextelata TaxID=1174677 RepID=UPI001D03F911|nr:uncharacterized protein H6S33_006472 [Morchella sextelata]KAH0604804.1 hypothetical protein H6S33_006472 [Morchella sextelata]